MLLATLLLAAVQPAPPAPDPLMACAPRRNLTAAGPPPPVFQVQRIEPGPGTRIHLSVHRCPGSGYRVERQITRGEQDVGDIEWVPAAACPAIGGWIAEATRLRLPAPMLIPHRDSSGPVRGTWFVLDARHLAGTGSVGNLELHILEPPGAPPNPLSAWIRDGEQRFKTCRDQGHGGAGYAPGRFG